ncbi:Formate dehydrogenase [Chthoniobacter flavus Ellin428]|uniref:Formate dehydrogenase n=1 Tax=Chthoniobacter flavus Ellin428 TaxID=497964 RepID=B4CZ21_9BACT|nr:molybdopterin-dependent oxidoreductase [Chthoniobacter flavus]EDY20712.1 Formate dehydrogenase [Chthoniobacter flavus Ellin428]TCO89610.1 anaerobic selenocysteine-containing dehydrogenase [Chthoniobacter flavus]
MSNESSQHLSRRSFLRGGALGAAAASTFGLRTAETLAGHDGEYSKTAPPPTGFDFTKGSGQLQPDKIVDSACQFCNCNCRLKVHVKDGRVIDVLGEDADPVQAGGLCVKAEMMTQLVYNRFRLTRPLKRVGGEKGSMDSKFEPCSWEEALEIIAKKFLTLRDAGDAKAIANKTSGRLQRGTGSIIGRFFTLLGSPNDTDVGPVCNDAGGDALGTTFGLGNFTNGYGKDENTGKEDLGSARFFLFLGTNQAETQPMTFAYLLRERLKTKAKLIVIDPRLTPTGAQADEWIAPKPHTDLALVLAFLQHIIAQKLYDAKLVAKWVLGFDQLKKHLADHDYTPEWAEKITGVPATKIKAIAEGYAKARPAAIFCNAGISHQLGAFDTYRTLAFLAAITGNIGVHGGGCNFMHNTWPGGLNLLPVMGETPKKDGELPVGPDWFAESILHSRPYQLKAIVTEGNPLIGSANSKKVQEAFKKLEFYVFTGLFMEEAAYYADVILPVASGFEMDGVYMRRDDRAIRWQHAAVARVGESKTDIEIWIDLAAAMAKLDTKNKPEYWTGNLRAEWKDFGKLWAEFVARTPGVGGMSQTRMEKRAEPLRWPCASEKTPGVSTLYLDHASWYQAAEALDPKNKGKRFLTGSGKVEIFTAELDQKLVGAGHSALPIFYTHPEVTGQNPSIVYEEELVPNAINPGSVTPNVTLGGLSDGKVHEQFPLMGMCGRASVVHFAGVTQWTYFGKQMNGVRLVQIHPRTAEKSGVAQGDKIVIESPRGAITGTATLWEGIREDTIFIPNSFGPAQAMGDEFGLPRYETANTLLDDRYFDNLSGQQAYKCFAVRVRKA